MTDKLINAGPTVAYIPVISPTGAEEVTPLQPGGKLTLPLGYKVAPSFASEVHPKIHLNGKALTQTQPLAVAPQEGA